MTHFPLISIITAVRNGAPFIGQLIESVLQQDYPHFEHIVIDDGSTDDGATVGVLARYPHLRWWSRENKGQYATQNEGILAARGELIGVISADDVYIVPHTFSSIYDCWLAHPEVEVVYGRTLHMNQSGDLLPYQTDVTGKYARWLVRYFLFIQHCSLFVRRDLIVKHGCWFNPSFRYAGDWDWIVRVMNASSHVHYLNRNLSMIRDHPTQTSRTAASSAIVQEHRMVCDSYHSLYAGHLLLTKCNQYRAMTLIAAATLRIGGIKGITQLGRDWYLRRSKRPHI